MSDELDKHIGETLGRYASNVDAEALWQAVKPPRRRRPWLWWLLLAGVIAVAGGLWCWSAGHKQEFVVEEDLPVVAHTVNREEKEPLSGNSKIEEEPVAVGGDGAAVSAVQGVNIISKVADNGSESSSSNSKTEPTVGEEVANHENSGMEKTSTTYPQLEAAALGQGSADRSEANAAINFAEQEKAPASVLLPAESALIPTATSSERLLTAAAAIETLSFEAKLAGEEQAFLPAEPSVSTYRRSKARPFFAQLDVAYFGIQRELENKDALSLDWARQRVASEQLLEGLSADVSFGYRSRKGWQFRGGLGYTQLNTLFENTLSTQTVDTVEGLQMLIYNADNSVDSIFGPVAYYETTTRSVQTYNSIRQWELPLLAGYNVELGRLTLLAEAGLRLQLRRSWEGLVLNQEQGNDFQDLAATDWYRTGLGLSLQGGLQLAYPLTSQLDILAGGSARYNLQDFSGAESPFRERYHLLGGQLSLRYRF